MNWLREMRYEYYPERGFWVPPKDSNFHPYLIERTDKMWSAFYTLYVNFVPIEERPPICVQTPQEAYRAAITRRVKAIDATLQRCTADRVALQTLLDQIV